MEIVPSKVADVVGTRVMRALPRRGHRTIGPWCFLEHFQPERRDDRPG